LQGGFSLTATWKEFVVIFKKSGALLSRGGDSVILRRSQGETTNFGTGRLSVSLTDIQTLSDQHIPYESDPWTDSTDPQFGAYAEPADFAEG
jgi:hypothetical protein